tara:strand:+ start:53 stop:658 length:606 start_codon:yes stop_codon:yes gene_type:complete
MLLGMSYFFWAMIGVSLLALMWCAETESPFWGSFIVLGTFLVSWLIFGISVVTAVVSNPLLAAGAFAGYILAGIAWAYPKWWFHVRSLRNEYVDVMRAFLSNRGYEGAESADEIPAQYLNAWHSTRSYSHWSRIFPILARANKRKIMTWMVWWPVSMVWTLINDPIRKMYRYIWDALRSTFDRVAASAMGGVEIQRAPTPE